MGKQAFLIREAERADGPILGAIRTAAWRTTYRGLLKATTLAGLDGNMWAGRWMKNFNPDAGDFALLAFAADGLPCAFLTAGPGRDGFTDYCGEIYTFYVLETHQGQGIGRALFLEAHRRLMERSFVPFYLYVVGENARSVAWYIHAGGRPLGRDRKFEIDGVWLTDHALGWDRAPFAAS